MSTDFALRESTQTTLPPQASDWTIPDGTAVGRFIVLATVGRGATGVVVAAWDGELGRKVAIKFLAPGVAGERKRLRTEAQALARLTHPNVIRIHDVGEHDGRVYMVMEYVEGDTMAGPRATAAVALWIAAGRGLAAAHAAGLVHGDFKPANVLLGPDGRPRVSDFGHARVEASGGAEASEDDSVDDAAGPRVADVWTTRSGTLVGTPAYMAPEVFAGALADTRSDQFSYCVALYEALWAARPFEGRDVASLAAAVSGGAVRPPPAFPVVPRRIRRAVLRGLAQLPSARFPSMDALLAELERDPWKWPRRLAPLGVIPALSWIVAANLAADAPVERDYCAEVERRADALWNDDRAGAIEAAFLSTGVLFAADEFVRARVLVEEHARALRESERSACEIESAGTTAPEDVSARQLCLHLNHQQLAGLLDLFERADAAVVEHASDAARRLPPLDQCTAGVRWGPRYDANNRDELFTLAAEIARARVAADAWRDAAALEAAQTAATRATELDAPWLTAESQMIAGRVLERGGDGTNAMPRFDAAFAAALAADHHDVAVLAALGVAGQLAERGDHDNAIRWLDHAAAALSAAGPRVGSLQAALLNTRGQVAYHHGDFVDAKRHFTALLASEPAQGSVGDEGTGSTLLNIGLSDANLGHVDEAIVFLRKAVEVETSEHGADHPALIRPLNAVCHVEIDRGEVEAAIVACQRALDLARASGPSAAPRLSHLYTNLGSAHFHGGQPAQAEAAHLAALDNAMRTQPDDDLLVATIANNLGVLYDHLERVDEAAKHYGHAYDRVRRAFGPDHPSTAMVGTNLAMVRVKQGDLDGAEALLRDGLERMSARLGADHPDLALSYAELGRIAAKRGEHQKALVNFERAFALREAHGGDDIELADTAWGLAISLAKLEGLSAKVLRTSELAERLYRKAGGDWAARADEVVAWRAGLG